MRELSLRWPFFSTARLLLPPKWPDATWAPLWDSPVAPVHKQWHEGRSAAGDETFPQSVVRLMENGALHFSAFFLWPRFLGFTPPPALVWVCFTYSWKPAAMIWATEECLSFQIWSQNPFSALCLFSVYPSLFLKTPKLTNWDETLCTIIFHNTESILFCNKWGNHTEWEKVL